jgi:hypothetical protein
MTAIGVVPKAVAAGKGAEGATAAGGVVIVVARVVPHLVPYPGPKHVEEDAARRQA